MRHAKESKPESWVLAILTQLSELFVGERPRPPLFLSMLLVQPKSPPKRRHHFSLYRYTQFKTPRTFSPYCPPNSANTFLCSSPSTSTSTFISSCSISPNPCTPRCTLTINNFILSNSASTFPSLVTRFPCTPPPSANGPNKPLNALYLSTTSVFSLLRSFNSSSRVCSSVYRAALAGASTSASSLQVEGSWSIMFSLPGLRYMN